MVSILFGIWGLSFHSVSISNSKVLFPNIRWSHALLFHQSVVDFLRSCILIPLGISILGCKAIHSCNILETSFLLLVTASTVRYTIKTNRYHKGFVKLAVQSTKSQSVNWLYLNLGFFYLLGYLKQNRKKVE